MNKKIIIAGGGTGGHIFPAIAIVNGLKRIDAGYEFLFIGANSKMEMEKVPLAGFAIKGIDIAGFNRSSLLKNIALPFKIVKSFFQVRKIFSEFKPDAVIGVGGYSTFPVLKLAQQRGLPNFIFEVNSFAGKANLMLGKKATKIFTASDGMEKFFPAEKVVVTGNPIRKDIVDASIDKHTAVAHFGFGSVGQIVLVFGGSLGAKSINEAIVNGLDRFEKSNLQLIWQTGKATADQFVQKAAGRKNVWAGAFIDRMDIAYQAADIIVCRSGGTVYELCVAGRPAILVPYPFASEDHQTANAERLVSKDAALMIKDSEASEKLIDLIIDLAGNENLKATLSQNIKALAITNADDMIAKQITEIIKNS